MKEPRRIQLSGARSWIVACFDLGEELSRDRVAANMLKDFIINL